MSDPTSTNAPEGWRDAWPDLLAFAGGLALAWAFHWATTDLVWSLWLSSLLVGYATIVWNIFGPALWLAHLARTRVGSVAANVAIDGALLVGGVFMLAFFTVHFGLFHLIHSVFLNYFFPVTRAKGFPGMAAYLEVLRRYWYFVPIAALAERKAFRLPAQTAMRDAPVGDAVIAASRRTDSGMMEPYKNVVRMHMLIFFFAFAHFIHLENFGVYAAVYAVYFFPWRLVPGFKPAGAASPD